jgi:hypothetical protein
MVGVVTKVCCPPACALPTTRQHLVVVVAGCADAVSVDNAIRLAVGNDLVVAATPGGPALALPSTRDELMVIVARCAHTLAVHDAIVPAAGNDRVLGSKQVAGGLRVDCEESQERKGNGDAIRGHAEMIGKVLT